MRHREAIIEREEERNTGIMHGRDEASSGPGVPLDQALAKLAEL